MRGPVNDPPGTTYSVRGLACCGEPAASVPDYGRAEPQRDLSWSITGSPLRSRRYQGVLGVDGAAIPDVAIPQRRYFIFNGRKSEDRSIYNNRVYYCFVGEEASTNAKFRKVVGLSIVVHVYSDVYQTLAYTHTRSTSTVLQILNGSDIPDVLADIGKVHRTFCWEKVLLMHDSDKPPAAKASGSTDPAPVDSASTTTEIVDTTKPTGDALAELISKDPSGAAGGSGVVKYLVDHIAWTLTPFFQGNSLARLLSPLSC